MTEDRYEAVADFYESGWVDAYDDPVSLAFLELLGPLGGLRVLDIACGHGRFTRELARRGAQMTGVDLSAALVAKAREIEEREPLGICYLHADVASDPLAAGATFDVVSCSFGLSDIDDLDGALRTVSRVLRSGGRFVFRANARRPSHLARPESAARSAERPRPNLSRDRSRRT